MGGGVGVQGIQWVGAGWVLRGCCVGVQRVHCNPTKRQYTGSHTNPLGAHRNFPWVQRGCTVGVAMGTMFLADFAWVGGGWVQCSMKNRGWEVGV